MDWKQVEDTATVVLPILGAIAAGSAVVVSKLNRGRRLAFLGACALVVFHRVEWERSRLIDNFTVTGWDPINEGYRSVDDPIAARMRAQMLIGEMCFQAGEKAPDLKETKWLDTYFASMAKAVKLSGPLLKR